MGNFAVSTGGTLYTALPLIYALLSSKETSQYESVLRSVQNAAQNFRIQNCRPQKIMTDFELSIINGCSIVYLDVPLSARFFHLGYSVYRKIQSKGLQGAYNDQHNRDIKTQSHMWMTLAYVTINDIPECLEILQDSVSEEWLPIIDYIEYKAALYGSHKTKNVREGWHNRFKLLVGKHHHGLYSALKEFQKEQSDTETAVAELSLEDL